MPDIALPPFHIKETKMLTVELHYELQQDLSKYRDYYRHAYGGDVAESDLVREMARRFMEADREFQSFRTGARPRQRDRRPVGNGEITKSA